MLLFSLVVVACTVYVCTYVYILAALTLSSRLQTAASISGKTDFVVAGTVLDDGRPVMESSKYRTAVEKNVKF